MLQYEHMSLNDNIRPIYEELQGILSNALSQTDYLHSEEKSLWERVNKLCEKLSEITEEEDFMDFKIEPRYNDGYPTVSGNLYRGKVSSLISKLFGTYFSKEDKPFSGSSPKTIMTQNTSVDIQLYVQLGAELQNALSKAKTVEEKSFVEKVKEKIGTVKTYVDFLLLIVSTAQQFKIDLGRIMALFERV